MNGSISLRFVVYGSAALIALTACTGGANGSAPISAAAGASQSLASRLQNASVRRDPFALPFVRLPQYAKPGMLDLSPGFARADAASKAAVIVSDYGTGDVNAYATDGTLVAQITGFRYPQGIAAKPNGDFYVVNTGGSDVFLFKNDYKTLVASLSDPGQVPAGVDYSAATGVVGVTNVDTGSVSMYAAGKTLPCATISNPGQFSSLFYGAFDAAGNFFVDGFYVNGNNVAYARVGEVIGGCKGTTIKALTTGNFLAFPGGVRVTPSGQIAIGDQEYLDVYTYNAPVNGSLGMPVRATHLNSSIDPISFSFTRSATALWEADFANSNVAEFAYPGGGKRTNLISTDLSNPNGILVTPAALP